jgi:glyoxylase-like metal-dependent hydrolase (beta-lactamase superfamily II)
MVTGGVANTGFVVGEREVLAIDAEMTADSAQKMIDLIKKTTDKPLTKLVLTHSDGDHVNGIGGFPKGLEIYSSEGAKKEMQEAFESPAQQQLKAYLPNHTFSGEMEIDLGNERIRLLHFGPAHTSGDIVLFLPDSKLAFVGDLVFLGRDPLIHRHKNGTALGLIKNLQSIFELDADRYVSGHNDILSRQDVEAVLKNMQDKVQEVRLHIRDGKSLDETKKAFGIEDPPAKAGGFRFPSLVETIYLELAEN